MSGGYASSMKETAGASEDEVETISEVHWGRNAFIAGSKLHTLG